jgi:hypothetical protein
MWIRSVAKTNWNDEMLRLIHFEAFVRFTNKAAFIDRAFRG